MTMRGIKPTDILPLRWHDYKGQRRENILFGGSHAEFYKFRLEMNTWLASPATDSKFSVVVIQLSSVNTRCEKF